MLQSDANAVLAEADQNGCTKSHFGRTDIIIALRRDAIAVVLHFDQIEAVVLKPNICLVRTLRH